MIKKLKMKIAHSKGSGLFHDSRKDVNQLAHALKLTVKKVDELVDEVNKLKQNQPGGPYD